MEIRIKYLGMISESTGKADEVLKIEESTLSGLEKILMEKYPKLKENSFKFAINHSLSDNDEQLNENDEVAVLPPFAGG